MTWFRYGTCDPNYRIYDPTCKREMDQCDNIRMRVVREKSSGLPGLIQQVSIQKMSWNMTPQLSESNLVRYRPLSAGPLSNAFDNLGTTLITYNGNSYNVGNELFYFASPESVSSFTISYHRPAYRPGFQIFKNGVLVYTDASVTTTSDNPQPLRVTYNV